jgi:hypothetical protein
MVQFLGTDDMVPYRQYSEVTLPKNRTSGTVGTVVLSPNTVNNFAESSIVIYMM